MIAVLVGSAGMSASADFQKGYAAYQSGDYATALREFQPLAKQGYAPAQFNLGVLYEEGLGVPKNNKTAMKWYSLAAVQGHAKSQYNMGVMYSNGKGVLQDYKTAVKWYRLAAEQGHAKSHTNLGVMYGTGKGVLKDYIYAHMWGNIGAMNGNKKGAGLRDFVGTKMTPADISKAQDLARECVRKKYKGC